ncbi:MAG: adenylate kinase, partial [Omnitrophica bacterium RIFCSPHIGHO2_02_FULL_49_9]
MARDVVLLGPPGAGKGTHARILSERYRVPHIAAGDLLRSNIKEGTPLGKRAKSFVENGKLVPDQLVIEMIEKRLQDSDVAQGSLLDGFPRTVEQAKALDQMLSEKHRKVRIAVEFNTSEQKLIERLSGRQTCPNCGANYHVRNIPPKREGICDLCGTALTVRTDDRPDTIHERF